MRRVEGGSDIPVDAALAPTLAPLQVAPAEAFRRLAALGFRRVQLAATQPGFRPRELDRSARRDLGATLRRREMTVAGIDLWIPPAHFLDPARVDRAVAATIETLKLAADLDRCPVCLELPEDGTGDEVIATMRDAALHEGIALADHAVPPAERPGIGVGVDPVAWMADGRDPVEAVAMAGERLVSARVGDLLRGGLRGPLGGDGGRLDVAAYHTALALRAVPVVIDARQWADPWAGLERTARAWAR